MIFFLLIVQLSENHNTLKLIAIMNVFSLSAQGEELNKLKASIPILFKLYVNAVYICMYVKV